MTEHHIIAHPTSIGSSRHGMSRVVASSHMHIISHVSVLDILQHLVSIVRAGWKT